MLKTGTLDGSNGVTSLAELQCHNLAHFGLSDMIECGRFIRSSTRLSGSMEESAQLLVRYLYGTFRKSAAGTSDCALVRCFKTHRLSTLPASLPARTTPSVGEGLLDDIRCLTLLATAGDLPAWNQPSASSGHAVIPLEDAEAVSRAPMIAQLIRQLWLEVRSVLAPDEKLLLEADERTYGVFHVEEAAGSPFIPAPR